MPCMRPSVGPAKGPKMSVRVPTALLNGDSDSSSRDDSDDQQQLQLQQERGGTKRDAIAAHDESDSEQPSEKVARQEEMVVPPSPPSPPPAASVSSSDVPMEAQQQNPTEEAHDMSISSSAPASVHQSPSSSSVDVELQQKSYEKYRALSELSKANLLQARHRERMRIDSETGGVDAPTREVEMSESTREINRLKRENAELSIQREEYAQKYSIVKEELENMKQMENGDDSLDKDRDLYSILTDQLQNAVNEIKMKDKTIAHFKAEMEISIKNEEIYKKNEEIYKKNEEIYKEKIDVLTQANAAIDEKFKEMRKRAKAAQGSGDISDAEQQEAERRRRSERSEMERELARLNERLAMAKRVDARTKCRELMLLQKNTDLKIRLDETSKANQLITGGMMNLLAQSGVQSLQPQQQQQYPDPLGVPWSTPRHTMPSFTLMQRSIRQSVSGRPDDVITIDDNEPSTSRGGGTRMEPGQDQQPRRSGRARKANNFDDYQ